MDDAGVIERNVWADWDYCAARVFWRNTALFGWTKMVGHSGGRAIAPAAIAPAPPDSWETGGAGYTGNIRLFL